MITHYYGIFNTPLGVMRVCDDGEAILEVRFLDSIMTDSKKNTLNTSTQSPLTRLTMQQLEEYFAKKRTNFKLPLRPNGTAFQQCVWMALRTIPYGTICHYGNIAKMIQQPNSARAVGGANHRNPIAIIIPCHRVISASGKLCGYAGGMDRKLALLELEGVKDLKI